MKRLLRLYPRGWRERYGDEFVALLDNVDSNPRAIADVARGALVAQLDQFVHRPALRGSRPWALTERGDPMVRTLLGVLAVSTIVIALYGARMVFPLRPELMAIHTLSTVPWIVAVAVGVVTLVGVFAPPPARDRIGRFVSMAGVLLAAAGIAGAVSVLELGRLTGDYEWGIANVYALLVFQGALTALYFSGRLGGAVMAGR